MRTKPALRALFLLFLGMAACTPKDQGPQDFSAFQSRSTYPNLIAAAQDRMEISMILALGSKVTDGTIFSKEPFTVFAPTNRAFREVRPEVFNKVGAPQDPVWPSIFWNHFTRGIHTPDKLKDGQLLRQMNGEEVTITIKGGEMAVNGNPVRTIIHAGNGIIYEIDRLLLPKALESQVLVQGLSKARVGGTAGGQTNGHKKTAPGSRN